MPVRSPLARAPLAQAACGQDASARSIPFSCCVFPLPHFRDERVAFWRGLVRVAGPTRLTQSGLAQS
eukprot:4025524-Pyramimonas_sp.AAC.1